MVLSRLSLFSGRSRCRIALALALLLAVVGGTLLAGRLRAEDAPSDGDAIGSGTLLLSGKGVAESLPAVRLGTDMDVTVSGAIARVRVTQAFRNTSDRWMEATYLYPLPEDGAVDSLKMVVGDRVIVGHIKRRAEAREIYEKARERGQKAGLVEAERPNMFRNSVANVGPGETVLIQIEYQAPVRQVSGEFSLRLPLVVGPRYVPAQATADNPARTEAAVAKDIDEVTAPLAAPALGKGLNPVSITVHLAPGFVPANLISPYHRIAVSDDGAQTRTIRLADGEVPADRDFELRWRSASADPTLSLFRQSLDGKDYVMAAIVPPARLPQGKAPPREMVFVIDNSGSMGGQSMDAAKESLLHALDTLRPEDRFNVIRFDDTMTQLFDQSVPATPEQVATARRFTEGLEANGGTEMLPALKAALVDATPDEAPNAVQGVRQVVFLTDGDLSNEKDMMAEIAAHGGRSRVFMVGIGSAPNTFLMRRMAEAGRGTYTNIGDGSEVNAKMTALLDRLKAPVARDLKVTVDGAPIDFTPRRLPDLYVGEPLVLLGRGQALSGRLTVSGMIGDKPWSQTVDLSAAVDSPAVARLWANRRVAEIEAARAAGEVEDDQADGQIADLGLAYSLVTSQTSLVAVDETPTRPAGARLTREELPLLLPAGWDFDTLFNGAAAHATPPTVGAEAGEAEAVTLPRTATGYMALVEKGGLALLLGAVLLLAGTRRKVRA
ncbi:MAG: marine proteobacterial sortase target protein [Novosphingobium sp. SCN 66-18]|nr:MAG: marine proteobacterial sortase target protein [Novosphingobium sp. SCN 66-18]